MVQQLELFNASANAPIFYDGESVHALLLPYTRAQLLSACAHATIPVNRTDSRLKDLLMHRIGSSSEAQQRALRTFLLSLETSRKRKAPAAHRGRSPSEGRSSLLPNNMPEHDPSVFMKSPSETNLRSIIAAYISRTNNNAMKTGVCAVCATEHDLKCLSPYTTASIPNRAILRPLRPHPAHVLTDEMLLHPPAIASNGDLALCRPCELKLSIGQLPPLALANNMWIGEIPLELSILTLPERLLIAKYYPSAFIVKLYPKKHGGDAHHSGIRGNVSSYHLDSDTIADMIKGDLLPRTPAILPAIIGVAFVGFKEPPSKKLPDFLMVRRERVRAALVWLRNNNPLYCDVDISDDALSQLPLNGVPGELLSTTRISDDMNILSHEHDGYVPDQDNPTNSPDEHQPDNIHDEDEDVSMVDVDMAQSDEPWVVPLQASGAVDVAGHSVPDRELFAHALFNTSGEQQTPHETYIVRKGSAFVNEYARVDPVTGERFDGGPGNPNHLLGAFPTLFPYGLGGFEVARRINVPYEAHARWAMQYADRRFRRDVHFVFQVFGVIQKRKICRSATLQLGRKTFLDSQIALRSLKPGDFVKASEEETRGVAFSNPAIQSLRSQLRAVRVRVPGTDESRSSIRSKIWGCVAMYAPPSLWITINPSDMHDPVAQVLTGADIDLDKFHKTAGPTAHQRAVNISSDPFAAARYFHFIISVVLEELFGIRAGRDRRSIHRQMGIEPCQFVFAFLLWS